MKRVLDLIVHLVIKKGGVLMSLPPTIELLESYSYEEVDDPIEMMCGLANV